MRHRISKLLLTTAGLLPLAGLVGGCVYHERDHYRTRREVVVEDARITLEN